MADDWISDGAFAKKRVTRDDGTEYELAVIEYVEPTNPLNDNIDVWVRFGDGLGWVATFYTPLNIERLLEHENRTGQDRGGLYFFDPSFLIVRRLDRETIEAAAEGLIDDGHLESVFERTTD